MDQVNLSLLTKPLPYLREPNAYQLGDEHRDVKLTKDGFEHCECRGRPSQRGDVAVTGGGQRREAEVVENRGSLLWGGRLSDDRGAEAERSWVQDLADLKEV